MGGIGHYVRSRAINAIGAACAISHPASASEAAFTVPRLP